MTKQVIALLDLQTTVKLQVEAHVTIQKIKSLGVLQTETCHYTRHVFIHKFKKFEF